MRPVELAFQLLELIGAHQPIGVSELARISEIPKSTAQRALLALRKTGWIALSENDRALWVLTTRAMITCGRPTRLQADLRDLALPVMEDLRRASEETVHLTVRYRNQLVLLERLDGIKPVRYFFSYGGVAALHASASGKAVLARMSAQELDAFLARPLLGQTPTTIVDPDELRADLNEVRRLGYATSNGGLVADVNAIGAAILDLAGRPVAALSISAPADRLTPESVSTYGALVSDAARRVSLGVRTRTDAFEL